jgi:ubiquinone/menaquinone biosynthesis C-methylase UbiE
VGRQVDNSKELSKYFDNFSGRYDKSAFEQSLGTCYLDEIERNFISESCSIKKGDVVLDIGVGTGRNAGLLVNKGAVIECVDISRGMLREAKKKLKGKPVNFKVANVGEEIPYPDNAFDYVVCIRVLKYIPAWQKTISEVSRVLKKDGIFIFDIANLYSIAYFCFKKTNYFLFKFNEVKELLEKEGFQLIRIKTGSRLPFPLYNKINNLIILTMLKYLERTMDAILPKTILSRNILITAKNMDRIE